MDIINVQNVKGLDEVTAAKFKALIDILLRIFPVMKPKRNITQAE